MEEQRKKILFVDGEQSILDGLRRLLHPMRKVWEMTFATHADEALNLMTENHYDVIVSEIKLPDMEGKELLQSVKTRHPESVRIVLTGHVEQEAIFRSLGVVHLFLSKPTTPELLKSTIQRASSLRLLLGNQELKNLVSGMDSLPSLPTLYTQLMEEMQSENASLKKVGEIVSQDIGMTAKVLHLVNSAFFGLPREVTNPTLAINLLGLDILMSLVLSVHVFSAYDTEHLPRFSLERFWAHCLGTAVTAKKIAKTFSEKVGNPDDAFVAGMLHDAGKLILMANHPSVYSMVQEYAVEKKKSINESEKIAFTAGHQEVGAYLLALWGLPDPVIEAVAYHHTPKHTGVAEITPLTAVYIANILERLVYDGHEDQLEQELDLEYIDALHLTEQIPHWIEFGKELQPK